MSPADQEASLEVARVIVRQVMDSTTSADLPADEHDPEDQQLLS